MKFDWRMVFFNFWACEKLEEGAGEGETGKMERRGMILEKGS